MELFVALGSCLLHRKIDQRKIVWLETLWKAGQIQARKERDYQRMGHWSPRQVDNFIAFFMVHVVICNLPFIQILTPSCIAVFIKRWYIMAKHQLMVLNNCIWSTWSSSFHSDRLRGDSNPAHSSLRVKQCYFVALRLVARSGVEMNWIQDGA